MKSKAEVKALMELSTVSWGSSILGLVVLVVLVASPKMKSMFSFFLVVVRSQRRFCLFAVVEKGCLGEGKTGCVPESAGERGGGKDEVRENEGWNEGME